MLGLCLGTRMHIMPESTYCTWRSRAWVGGFKVRVVFPLPASKPAIKPSIRGKVRDSSTEKSGVFSLSFAAGRPALDRQNWRGRNGG